MGKTCIFQILGQCYAIPTMQGGIETIRPYVDEFIEYAKQHPELLFRVTRIGCGIAGFTNEEIAPLFKAAFDMENVSLPNGITLPFVHLSVAESLLWHELG